MGMPRGRGPAFSGQIQRQTYSAPSPNYGGRFPGSLRPTYPGPQGMPPGPPGQPCTCPQHPTGGVYNPQQGYMVDYHSVNSYDGTHGQQVGMVPPAPPGYPHCQQDQQQWPQQTQADSYWLRPQQTATPEEEKGIWTRSQTPIGNDSKTGEDRRSTNSPRWRQTDSNTVGRRRSPDRRSGSRYRSDDSPLPRNWSDSGSERDTRRDRRRDDRRERRSEQKTDRGSDNDGKNYKRKRERSSEREESESRDRTKRSHWRERSYRDKRSPPSSRSSSRSHSSSRRYDRSPRREQDVRESRKRRVRSRSRSRSESPQVMQKTEAIVTTSPLWLRCSAADLYFQRDLANPAHLKATDKMVEVEDKFENSLVNRATTARMNKPAYTPPDRKPKLHLHCHHDHDHDHDKSECHSSSSSSSSESDDDDDEDEPNWMDEMNRKKNHPYRLHDDLWFNERGEMNDGPLCRCSVKARQTGIRHSIYPGEEAIHTCDMESNNIQNLYHYRITMSPHTNFLTKNPTLIEYDSHEYIFEGFSLFTHYKIEGVPVCKVIRFNIEYTIHIVEEKCPENFTSRSLDLFTKYLYNEILQLVDLHWKGHGVDDGCNRFHLMPRFARDLPENGKEILSMNEVLNYMMRSSQVLIDEMDLGQVNKKEQHEWSSLVDEVRGMIVTYPGMEPSSIRVDQLDREQLEENVISYPRIVHFGIKPAQLSYVGDPNYQKLWKQYVKFKHLLANKPKVTAADKQRLQKKEEALQEIRQTSSMKREVTVEITCEGFTKTGIKSDICQHAMLLPVLISHLRFHKSLDVLENIISYKFKDRNLLQLAMTHPSYRVNFGTNPDHARNSLSNCGVRQPEFGDRKIQHMHSRKRGINTLISIMSRMGNKTVIDSEINHYERLEFLGDAVVEFISSIHLYYMFPNLAEGGLATYRAAIVQNQHLAVLAKKLRLQEFMLYAHGPDLCHESDLKHAMANCLEALMGALFIDGGIELADRIFGQTLFENEDELARTWFEVPRHPLQEEEPLGDRHWIDSSKALQKMKNFEDATGIEFNHIRLLARAFTLRNVGFNNLTLGHNQRLEFLGDTVLQLVASEYLFKHFPEHHEGHLSLLRSSLVNNKTQSVVCDDLGMCEFIIFSEDRGEKIEMKMKEKADLLEAFIGALYVDKDLLECRLFCQVCFFPRLKTFIMNQDWNDPKSQLQQCCLTLRELDSGEPDIPVYKVIESAGPTNTRKYTVAVYFRGERLATGMGHSIHQAEMAAAANALDEKSDLFPQLIHQKKFIERKYRNKASSSPLTS